MIPWRSAFLVGVGNAFLEDVVLHTAKIVLTSCSQLLVDGKEKFPRNFDRSTILQGLVEMNVG
jgi:hypothetical protein